LALSNTTTLIGLALDQVDQLGQLGHGVGRDGVDRRVVDVTRQ
jgi:hypothetical protein